MNLLFTSNLFLTLWSTCWASPSGTTETDPSMYRLPGNIKPLHYDLKISTYLDTENDKRMSFDGEVVIEVECVRATDVITLNMKNLQIRSLQVLDKTDNSLLIIQAIEDNRPRQMLAMTLDEDLDPSKSYKISIAYTGKFESSTAQGGYMRREYIDYEDGNSIKYMAATYFEPVDARTAFPCFDEPAMKATFNISIQHQVKYTAISNMPERTKEAVDGAGMVWTHFQTTPSMSTYLVAFAVCEYTPSPTQVLDGVSLRTWTKRSESSKIQFALDEAKAYLTHFTQLYGIGYPLPKMDFITLPSFPAEGMENWGLVTFAETALLADSYSSIASKEDIAQTIAHELAHQWFGNLVTMQWWDDLWLNEAFASYMSLVAVNNHHPDWNIESQETIRYFQRILRDDSLVSSHPVSDTTEDPRDILETFDAITYLKGALIVRMMKLVLGDSLFEQGIRNYMEQFAYGNAEKNNLLDFMRSTDESINVRTFMNSWIDQKGYPVVTITTDTNGKLVLRQEQYLKDTSVQSAGCWWIPIKYKTEGSKTVAKVWLRCPEDEDGFKIDAPPNEKWILFNIEGTGLYRIAYHEDNWNRLAEALKTEEFGGIDTFNRVQLIDDSFNLASTDHITFDSFFAIIKYLKNENYYLPWLGVIDITDQLHNLYEREESYDKFAAFMRKLLTPAYGTYGGFGSRTNEKLRILINTEACRYGVEACIIDAKNSFESRVVSEDDKQNVYCTVIANDGESNTNWNDIMDRYRANKGSAEEALILLKAMSCTRKQAQFSQMLNLLITGNVEQNSIVRVFYEAYRNRHMYGELKNFVWGNIDRICELFESGSLMEHVIKPIAQPITRAEDFTEFKNSIATSAACFEATRSAVERIKDIINLNIQWHEANFQKFTDKMEEWSSD